MSQNNKIFLDNYNKYLDKIYNYIWYRVGFDKSVTEDLCSEIFLKAYKGFKDFDQSKPFQSWIYAIAKNHLLNYYRVNGREVSIECAIDISHDALSKLNSDLEVQSSKINNKTKNQVRIVL